MTQRHASYRREPQDVPLCCGRRMILRTSRDGRKFYGCHAYPSCKAAMPANVPEPDWGWGKPNKGANR